MKLSFLKSLEGRTAADAEAHVRAAGFDVMTMPHGVAAIAIAMPQTVKLWLDEAGNVREASAGDPLEVEFNQ